MGRSGTGLEVLAADTGGTAPLSASVVNTGNPETSQYRAFSNNAGTSDISIFDVNITAGQESIQRINAPSGLANAQGNLALMDMDASPVRWAHMPIQCVVSPVGSTKHGRYLVVCNKTSMNVSIISLDSNGNPKRLYTFPAGLGSHGVAFGRKATQSGIAYYAYVTNTFENYVSVYDLQLLEELAALEAQNRAPRSFLPGSAREKVSISGYAAQQLTGKPQATLPITLFSPDARGMVHVGDIPLPTPPQPGPRAFLKEPVWVNLPGVGEVVLDLDLKTDTGGMGVFCTPLPPPWGN